MYLEEALFAHATSDVGLGALIGTRFRPLKLDEADQLPGIAYQMISTVTDYAHDGPSSTLESRYQFTVKAATYGEAKAVKEALEKAFQAFDDQPGQMGGASGVLIADMFVENEVDIYGGEEVEAQESYIIPVDYIIDYYESLP